MDIVRSAPKQNTQLRCKTLAHDPSRSHRAHATQYLETLSNRPVAAMASLADLIEPLPEAGTDAQIVIDELVRDTDGGLMGSSSGRFFGWVIGGTLPAALAAAWPGLAARPGTAGGSCGSRSATG